MTEAREDRLGNFKKVTHAGTGKIYRLHQDDLPKLGTPAKVAVYEMTYKAYEAPSAKHPKGKYISEVKFFLANYLALVLEEPDEPFRPVEVMPNNVVEFSATLQPAAQPSAA